MMTDVSLSFCIVGFVGKKKTVTREVHKIKELTSNNVPEMVKYKN